MDERSLQVMNREFKILLEYLHRKQTDLSYDVREMLEQYMFMFDNKFKVVIFVVVPCPIKDCSGQVIISSNRTIKDKVICDICHERIDSGKFRNRVFKKD